MAEEAQCNKLAIIDIRINLRQFGSVHAPLSRVGRERTVTPLVIEALCDHLHVPLSASRPEVAF